MSSVLYYSKFCNHCKELITRIAKTKTKNELHFVCIDNREKHTDGTTNIILENGQRLLLPPNVKTVPSILLLHHGNRVLGGIKEILHYLKPGEETIMNQATNFNGEPKAFSFCEMGSSLSDNYSYLDMTSEELSAKGNGGLRTMHSYTKIQDNQAIETPPDDYEPDKVKESDLGKIEAKRSQDVANINY